MKIKIIYFNKHLFFHKDQPWFSENQYSSYFNTYIKVKKKCSTDSLGRVCQIFLKNCNISIKHRQQTLDRIMLYSMLEPQGQQLCVNYCPFFEAGLTFHNITYLLCITNSRVCVYQICVPRFMNLKSHQDKYHNFKNVDTCSLCGKVRGGGRVILSYPDHLIFVLDPKPAHLTLHFLSCQ